MAISAEAKRDQAVGTLEDLFRVFRHAHLSSQGARVWADVSMSMAQMKALMMVIHTGGLRSNGLAQLLGVGPSAVTALVDKLVRAKLVRREHDPEDRRVGWVRPTARALVLNERMHASSREALRRIVDGLTPAELDLVTRALGVLQGVAHRALPADCVRRVMEAHAPRSRPSPQARRPAAAG